MEPARRAVLTTQRVTFLLTRLTTKPGLTMTVGKFGVHPRLRRRVGIMFVHTQATILTVGIVAATPIVILDRTDRPNLTHVAGPARGTRTIHPLDRQERLLVEVHRAFPTVQTGQRGITLLSFGTERGRNFTQVADIIRTGSAFTIESRGILKAHRVVPATTIVLTLQRTHIRPVTALSLLFLFLVCVCLFFGCGKLTRRFDAGTGRDNETKKERKK